MDNQKQILDSFDSSKTKCENCGKYHNSPKNIFCDTYCQIEYQDKKFFKLMKLTEKLLKKNDEKE